MPGALANVGSVASRAQRIGSTTHSRLRCACLSTTTTDKLRRCTGDPGSKQAFQDLGLRELETEWQTPRVRVRQHVNPFKKSLQIKHGPLPWAQVFQDPLAPLIVDVGCGYGRFPLQVARAYPQYNCLGLEIRAPTVDRATRWAEALGLQERLEFVIANATLSMKSMLASYPGNVQIISIQFPDPHFKRKHQKRHTVQPQFCSEVAEVLCPGGLVFVQSDVRAVVEYMRDTFHEAEPQQLLETTDVADITLQEPELLLRPRECCVSSDVKGDCCSEGTTRNADSSAWVGLGSNPLGLPTEREVHSADKGKEVYRFMLQKRQ